MKTIILLLSLFGAAAQAQDQCNIRVSARGAFGSSPYGERFQNKLNELLSSKGYVVLSHDQGQILADTDYKLYIDADFGFPCGTGVTTGDILFKNYSSAGIRLEHAGRTFQDYKTIKNLPLLPTGKANMHRAIRILIDKMPNCGDDE